MVICSPLFTHRLVESVALQLSWMMVDSMSTRGASGLTLDARWRMMGALESVHDMLLFVISTACIS